MRDAEALFIVAERDTRRVAYRHIQTLREKILTLREAPTGERTLHCSDGTPPEKLAAIVQGRTPPLERRNH